ncbi:MAG TPA: ATP synthase delta/epsilon chain alpha-helix domain-containing protein [Acidimicrobiales bacterium]|jgi:F-type H+-transporting ATPase subunit epsilon|nr:ATP synthase delta/epsilon chain alpha-helix domain-containing protein [Acidimicrobiales bacterium]
MADDDNLFSVQVLAPDRVLLTGRAQQVIMRTEDGDITFLDGHTPLVGAIVPCVVRVVREGDEEERLAVHGGFVQVEQLDDTEDDDGSGNAGGSDGDAGTRVTVLASVAELSEEIDVERARTALESAQARVTDLTAASGRGSPSDGDEADTELVEAQGAVQRAEVRLEASGATAAA